MTTHCGNCGEPFSSTDIKICPSCGAPIPSRVSTDSADSPTTFSTSLKQVPAAKEKPATPPPSPESGDSRTPSAPQLIPRKRQKKFVAFALALLSACVLIFVTVIGITNQVAVNIANERHATATATIISANPDPYDNAGGTLALYDPLTQSGKWPTESDTLLGYSCQYMSDGYHMVESKSNSLNNCDNDSRSFDNFVFEVKMTINQGDCGGLKLRDDLSGVEGYAFSVCSDGTYQIFLYTSDTSTTLKSGNNSGITSGQNTIAAVASGNNFNLYLNNTQLNGVSDSTYSQGNIGLIAIDYTNTTKVMYSNVRVWTL